MQKRLTSACYGKFFATLKFPANAGVITTRNKPGIIKYIELKSGFNDYGPGWIVTVKESRSGSTYYFNGMALKKRRGVSGNYFDLATENEYWISGIKILFNG